MRVSKYLPFLALSFILCIYGMYILFLFVRPKRWDGSLHPHIFILFRDAEKEAQYSKGYIPMTHFSL